METKQYKCYTQVGENAYGEPLFRDKEGNIFVERHHEDIMPAEKKDLQGAKLWDQPKQN